MQLKDVCVFRNGKAHEQFVDENGKYILVTSKFISTDGELFRKTNQQLTPLSIGDICMVMSDVPNGRALAKCFLVDENDKYTLNQRIGSFTVDDRFDKRYFYYLMNRNKYFLSFNDGNGQTNLRKDDILKFSFEYLPIEEQKSIVNNLDKVGKIIQSRKQELKTLDDLIKARFVEMFGESGKQVLLKDYVWFQEGPGVRSVDFTKSGTILLTGSNINNNTISFGYKSDRFISNELAKGKYAHFMCDKDDILAVSSAIDPHKFDEKVTIVKQDKRYCLNTGIIRFKPDKHFLTLGYFREFLKTDYFKHQVMEEMRGIAQMHFGPSHLKKMTILLPDSIEKQETFESFASQVDKSKFEVQKALDEAQLLFDSLMQKYFG